LLRLTKPFIGKEESEAATRILESGWLAEGALTQQFENEIARFVGAKYGVATCNCTIALTLCLKALGIKGEVSIPDFTHPATAQAVLNAGCRPVLCDVSLETYNMNTWNGARFAVPVSWAGNPLSVYPRTDFIEDAACSLGAGSTGSTYTACFSLHPRKLITTGEGAVVTTNDNILAEKLRDLKNFGRNGGNYRFNDVSAAIGIEQLKKLPRIIKVRCEQAAIYDSLLGNVKGVKIPQQSKGHVYQTYAVLLDSKIDRDNVIRKLIAKGIETQIGTYALHQLPKFSRLKRWTNLSVSSTLAKSLLALPMAYDLTFDDQQKVVEELKTTIV
jgi:dTDP-4-amino-4,6-dideoxygalactose transaminase